MIGFSEFFDFANITTKEKEIDERKIN